MQQSPFVNGLVSHNIVPPEMDEMVNGEYKLHRRLPKPIEFILVLGVLLWKAWSFYFWRLEWMGEE